MIKHSTVIRAPHWFSGKQQRLSYIWGHHNIELPKVGQFVLFQKKSGRSRNATKSQLGCIWMQFLQSPWNTSMMAISVSDICENTKVSHNQEFQLCFLWHKKHEYVLQFALKWLFSAGSWDELAWQLWDCKRLLSRSGAAGLIKFLWSLKFFSTLPNKTKDFWH